MHGDAIRDDMYIAIHRVPILMPIGNANYHYQLRLDKFKRDHFEQNSPVSVNNLLL